MNPPLMPLLSAPLPGPWQFRDAATPDWHPAEVPGCVHTDLLRNGLIPDPFYGANEAGLQWIGQKDWIYRTRFEVAPGALDAEHLDLVFRGLDTYATVTLNGRRILETDNMFREWRVSVKGLLVEHGNELEIEFRNVFDVTKPRWDRAPYRLQAFDTNDQAEVKLAMYSRKAQFHFGWDWGPRLITCGAWRPVLLEAWTGARLERVFVHTDNVSRAGADVIAEFEIDSDTAQVATLAVELDHQPLVSEQHNLQPGSNRVILRGRLANPKLWWTRGLGDPALYVCRATMNIGGTDAGEQRCRIGVRSLEIVRDRDGQGTSLAVRLNGLPVFAKGANYIPQDNFQNRVTRATTEHIIRSAAEANMNMLRLWGGGIYEDDTFYSLCDEYGILVWHDLQFACAMYPADPAFLATVREEIRDNVRRIRNHPCLALYCGNNENDLCWHQVWKQKFPPEIQAAQERDMHTLYAETFPAVLREVDPTRYYHSSSPNAGFNGISYAEGDIHYWGVWHGKEPFETYPDHIARFVSEFGFQSYPDMESIRRFIAPEDRHLHSPAMLSHQRCTSDERRDTEYGNRLIQSYLDRWYRKPKDFESYVYACQVLQAEGVCQGIEAHRRAMPWCMGSLYWQINDCWPAASWSSIDYYGRWKALHYGARRSFAPLLVSPVESSGEMQFWIVSDKLAPVNGVLEVQVLDFDGREVCHKSVECTAQAQSARCALGVPVSELTAGGDASRLVLVARLRRDDDVLAETIRCFRSARELALSNPEITVTSEQVEKGCLVTVTAKSFARNVRLTCANDDGSFSDNYFHLLPGRPETVLFRPAGAARPLEFRATSLFDSY
ncbi:MAG: glycoside hydrolase family 2 protein [Verrucomicrobiota bacterium]